MNFWPKSFRLVEGTFLRQSVSVGGFTLPGLLPRLILLRCSLQGFVKKKHRTRLESREEFQNLLFDHEVVPLDLSQSEDVHGLLFAGCDLPATCSDTHYTGVTEAGGKEIGPMSRSQTFRVPGDVTLTPTYSQGNERGSPKYGELPGELMTLPVSCDAKVHPSLWL